MRKIGEALESIVIVVIVLALVHTFMEDYAVVAGWTVAVRRWVIWTGLGFDLFFTIEFLTRLYLALSRHEGADYLFRQRGWIDFLASIPLLLLNSLPHSLALIAGSGLAAGLGSFLNVLKVIKAVRLARILRLLRVIKLFRGIRYARSALAQRHVSIMTTTAITILVFWMLGASILQGFGVFPGLEASYTAGQSLRTSAISAAGATAPGLARRAAEVAALDPGILVVRALGGPTAWSRYPSSYYEANFLPGDYGYVSSNGVEVFFDERPLAQASAREGIVFFIAVLLTVMGFLFLYAPRFALEISDPLHVMRRGMAEQDYNLEVKIPTGHEQEDVFELGALYNSVFLPMKDRHGGTSRENQQSSLKLDDIKDLLDNK